MSDTHRGDRVADGSAPTSVGADSPQDASTVAAGAVARPDRPTGPGWPPAARHGNQGHDNRGHDNRGQRGGHRPPPPPEEPTYRTGGLRLAIVVALTVLAGVRFGWPVLAMIGGIAVMIFLHELGHFLTAKWAGMKVTEFFLGFGPRIWSFRRGETEYGLKVVPAGAYVRIVGMNNLDEADPADEARTYRQQSFPKRLLVVCAGSIMHFAQAFVLLVIALGIVGVPGGSVLPDDVDPEAWLVTSVSESSGAAAAGLREDDRIVAIDGRPASSYEDGLSEAVLAHDVGDEMTFVVERDGEERTITAELGERPADEPGGEPGTVFLGVGSLPGYDSDPIGIGSAIVRAPGEMAHFTTESLGALVGFFSADGLGDFADNVNSAGDEPEARPGSGSAPADGDGNGDENRMMSIYGVVRLGADMGETGGAYIFLLLFFQINVFIGIFNMVPLPPLDGGHAAVAIYERFRSRRGLRYHADVAKLLPLTYAVVMGLVLLGVTSLYLDIVDPIGT